MSNEDLNDLLIEIGVDWSGFGVPTLKYVYSDFGGKFDEAQPQWVFYLDDLGTEKYRAIEDTPAKAVIESLRLIKAEDNRNWRKIRAEDRHDS